jgi:hypothetical protein
MRFNDKRIDKTSMAQPNRIILRSFLISALSKIKAICREPVIDLKVTASPSGIIKKCHQRSKEIHRRHLLLSLMREWRYEQLIFGPRRTKVRPVIQHRHD